MKDLNIIEGTFGEIYMTLHEERKQSKLLLQILC